MKVTYSSNNSGGSWWLTEADWKSLENMGWKVEWFEKDWLGAKARKASREGLALGPAIIEWESATGQDSAALGCSCCGVPHFFSFEGDNGETEYYSPEFPASGSRYYD